MHSFIYPLKITLIQSIYFKAIHWNKISSYYPFNNKINASFFHSAYIRWIGCATSLYFVIPALTAIRVWNQQIPYQICAPIRQDSALSWLYLNAVAISDWTGILRWIYFPQQMRWVVSVAYQHQCPEIGIYCSSPYLLLCSLVCTTMIGFGNRLCSP